MKESIKVEVVILDGGEATLTVEHEHDVVTFFINDQEIFSGDWTENFFELFCRAIGNWKRREL